MLKLRKTGHLIDFECRIVPHELAWLFPKLMMDWGFPTQLYGLQKMDQKTENIKWVAVLWVKRLLWLWLKVTSTLSWWEGNSNSGVHSLQPWYAEAHIWTDNTSNKKGIKSATPFSWKQETDGTVHKRSPTSNNRRLKKKVSWSDESLFLPWHSDGRVRILCKQHESMNPAYLLSKVQSAGDGVGDIVLAQFAPLSTSRPWFNQHSLPQYCS